MKVILQCHYCGSEDVKITIKEMNDETLTIKCKCGKWLVRNGIMGHKHNDY